MECIFTVISNLVSEATGPDDALAMADQIANKLTAQPIEKPVSRIKMYVFSQPLVSGCKLRMIHVLNIVLDKITRFYPGP